ncbi:enoyl-CoA hydratase/isomerase family protein [Myxococcota bacterium]|nr:enoyl-CoA hydratase/isomerase family protein [Myxococcota bacterium]
MGYEIDGMRVEVRDGVASVDIDAPPMNLLGGALLMGLDVLTRQVTEDDGVRVLVLRSANPHFFIAHGDVESIVSAPEGGVPEVVDQPGFVHDTLDRLRVMPKLTIAQIEGMARGGGSEVALACDLRFASRGRAVLGQPEVPLGILPGAGGTVRLMRLLGRARATEVILGGKDFTADEAERYGWINRALEPDEIGSFVQELARRVARFPANAIAETKSVLREMESGLQADLVLEQNAFNRLMSGPHAHPRMRDFLARGIQTPEGEGDLGVAVETLEG